MLRLVPLLARSVGLGPVLFPSQGSLGHRAIHGHPPQIDLPEFIATSQAEFPELPEDPGLLLFLKTPVAV